MTSDPSMQYIPRLWYYGSCTFLENQYLPVKDTRTANTPESHYDNDEVQLFYYNGSSYLLKQRKNCFVVLYIIGRYKSIKNLNKNKISKYLYHPYLATSKYITGN